MAAIFAEAGIKVVSVAAVGATMTWTTISETKAAGMGALASGVDSRLADDRATTVCGSLAAAEIGKAELRGCDAGAWVW